MLDARRRRPHRGGVRLGDERARRSARGRRHSARPTGRRPRRPSSATRSPPSPIVPVISRPAKIVDRYAARSGRDVSRIRYYEIFAVFKIAVVIQQIYCAVCPGANQRSALRNLRRARRLSGPPCGGPGGESVMTFKSAAASLMVVQALMVVSAQGKSTQDGVYTAAQATRGEAIYTRACASCHQPRSVGRWPERRGWSARTSTWTGSIPRSSDLFDRTRDQHAGRQAG